MTKKQLLSLAALVGLVSAQALARHNDTDSEMTDDRWQLVGAQAGIGVGFPYIINPDSEGFGFEVLGARVGSRSYMNRDSRSAERSEAAPKKNKRQNRKDTRAEKRARKAKTDASY